MSEPTIINYLRWSSPRQSEGDSERRQTESTERISRELSEQRGMPVDTRTDRGLSGYHEDHIRRGALGQLVQAVDAGEIAPGSALVIDSMSRFSRGRIGRVMALFEDLIESGVSIYIADQNKEYTQENFDTLENQLGPSLLAMMNREYARQLGRYSREMWEQKRKRFAEHGEPLSGRVPQWIRIERDERGRIADFHVIEERAAVVRRMFDMVLAGHGCNSIAATLNKEGAWAPTRKNRKYEGWNFSTVHWYLRNSAVIGRVQARTGRRENGRVRYEPTGEPRDNYYPAIVDEGVYARVQQILAQRTAQAGHAGGRVGNTPGLLAYLAVCARCGAAMAPESKARGRRYLMCRRAKQGQCVARRAPYTEIEEQVLQRCASSLDLADILDDKTQRNELARAQREREAREAERVDAENRRQRFIRRIGDEEDDAEAEAMRQEAAAERERAAVAEAARDDLDREIAALAGAPEEIARRLADIRELAQRLEAAQGDEARELRLRTREALRQIVRSVEVDAEAGWAVVRLGSRAVQRQHARGQPVARTRWTITWTPVHTRQRQALKR